MTTRADIVAEARTWLGTRYRHQARRKGVAVDCLGLVGGVAVALQLPGSAEWSADPNIHNYARTPDPALLMASCTRFLDRIAPAKAREGDVLVFAVQNEPRHFALVSECGRPMRIIHAYALLAARKVVEQSLPVAKARVIAAYSFRGIEA